MAVYNRKELTLSAIKQLHSLEDEKTKIDITVCDDLSTDGTALAISTYYPRVQIVQTRGNAYWAKSMHFADVAAFEKDYDYLVWMNDDTVLFQNVFKMIKRDYATIQNQECILVGPLKDPITGSFTYSGCLDNRIKNKIELTFVGPYGIPVQVGMFSGNFVVIPRLVRSVVGPIDKKFSHGWADMEYGYRSSSKGFPSYLMSSFVGSSAINPLYSFHNDLTHPLSLRLKHVYGRKGYQPLDYLRFCLKSFRLQGISIYFRNMFQIGKDTLYARDN
jgi:GT2 family glycosyltransferase